MSNDMLDRAAEGDAAAIESLFAGDWLDRKALAATLFLKATEQQQTATGASTDFQARAIRILDGLADDGCEDAGAMLVLAGHACEPAAWCLAVGKDAHTGIQ